MAKSHGGFDMREYRNELDRTSAPVLPNHSAVHGRLKIAEHELDDARETFARAVLSELEQKYPQHDSEELATVAIQKANAASFD
jgi:hypothetical protein